MSAFAGVGAEVGAGAGTGVAGCRLPVAGFATCAAVVVVAGGFNGAEAASPPLVVETVVVTGAATTAGGALVVVSCGTFSAFGYSPFSASFRSRPASAFATSAQITAASTSVAASSQNRLFIVFCDAAGF